MLHLIDRRPNDRGKSAVNRERFLRRYKTHIQEAVKKMVGERKLADMEQGGEVRVPRKDIVRARRSASAAAATASSCCPGNREYIAGDRIPRPEGGGRRRRRRATAARATAEDELRVLAVARRVHADLLRRPRAAAPRAHRVRPHRTRARASAPASPRPACRPTSPSSARMTQALARRIALGGGLAREVAGAAGGVRDRRRGRRRRARPRALHDELERARAPARRASRSSTIPTCATATASGGRSRSRARRCSA